MKTIPIPNKYKTFNGVQREVLKRGRKCFLEKQIHPGNKGTNFIVRERLIAYNEGLMANCELIPDLQSYERFKTKKEALRFFEAVEGGELSL